jgi:hypothetical protein
MLRIEYCRMEVFKLRQELLGSVVSMFDVHEAVLAAKFLGRLQKILETLKVVVVLAALFQVQSVGQREFSHPIGLDSLTN